MRRILALGLATIIVVAIGWFSYDTYFKNANENKATQISFRLAWVYDMAEVGVFVAQDKGLFQKDGLNVKVESGGFGSDPIKLVAAGTDDFGVAGAGNLLLARAQGVPVVAIGAEFQETPVGFIVHQHSGISTFRDFRGKRVGIQTGADTDVLYRALLARNRMSSADIQEVPIQYDATPFVSGQIDVLPGYVTNQPVTLRAKGIPVDVISASSQGLNYYGNVYFTSERMLHEHPDRVRAFLAAAAQGWNVAFADEGSAITAMQRRSSDFTAVELNTIYHAVVPFVQPEVGQPLLAMSAERWNTTRQVLIDAGMLKAQADLGKAYTNEYIK